MLGYHNKPEANKDVFVQAQDGGRPWMKTGDVADIKENGELFIIDRVKEQIKVKGFQVFPAELEDLLLDHTEVRLWLA